MNKTIFITGAGSGIGKDAAFELSQRGHRVITSTETDEQKNSLEKEIASAGLNIEVITMDVTIVEDRRKIESYDIDVLINNAGIGESGSLAEIDMDRVRRNFEVNVFSAFELSQLALKKMIQKDKGTVIFISSIFGRLAAPWLGPYSMTKFAVSSGAEALRTEIHRIRKNVHISVIEPGGYHTGFNQKNVAKKYEWMKESSPFWELLPQLKKEEERQFRFVEMKTTDSIVRKIVKAAEAKKPRLRYQAPWWQAWGSQVLRILGK